MAKISTITQTSRHEITVAIRPWFADHFFAGKVILPAVETMAILASMAKAFRPELRVGSIKEGRFDKFLAINPQAQSLTAWVEFEAYANGDLGATLATRTPMAAMTRVKEHGRIVFAEPSMQPESVLPTMREQLPGSVFMVDADRIYQELVPFGPAYRNINGSLGLSEAGGQAMVLAPELTCDKELLLGSPFPLDAAFHAACVWSQRYHGVVAFPVGLASRVIWQATRPGEQYLAWFKFSGIVEDLLLFDLEICDGEGTLCESVNGLQMRDVSGGRLKPPQWIRAEQ